MNATNTKRFGQFELLERIGSGGMAEVFKARIRSAGEDSRLLALKRMHGRLSSDREWVEMFTSEARITAQLQHPNIVEVLHFGRLDHSYYLAMEYIDGHDLGWLIERSNRSQRMLPLPIAIYIVRELCRALYHAHRHRDPQGKLLGIVHRDVSPQNVLVSRYGDVKLVDFGIAKAIHHSGETTHGKLKGKYGYMAPEQLQHDPVDRRTDIFALGAVFFETLTGQALFERTGILETTEAVLEGPIPPPSSIRAEIPAQLDEIVLKAVARHPRDRFDSARILRLALEDCARHSCGIAAAQDVAAWFETCDADDDAKAAAKGQRLLTHPESLVPTLPPVSSGDVSPGTLAFGDEGDETGITARKLPIEKPNFDDCDTAPKRASGEQDDWTIDEGGDFFEPSGNKSLDPNPEALLERLSSTENHEVLEEFGAEDEHEQPTAVALIDVETLLAKRNQQVQKGRSAEIPAPALSEEDALYAFTGEEDATQASPMRTAALLEDLENFPSAEVLISDLKGLRKEGDAPPAEGDATRSDLRAPSIGDATREDLRAPGISDATREDLRAPALSGATREELAAPVVNGVTGHDLADVPEGEGFDEDAETMLSVKPPSGMFPRVEPEDEVPEFPESTAISFSGVLQTAPTADPAHGRRQPAAPTDALSVDLRLPLDTLGEARPKSSPWFWVTVALLLLTGAAAIAYVLLS